MSTFVIHLLIPPLMALAIRYFRPQSVWAWAWISVLPDIDYAGWLLYVNGWVPVNVHRALFHNLPVLALLVGGSVLAFRKYVQGLPAAVPNPLAAFAHTRHGAGWMLSSYYYFSHFLLDSFQGGVVPFWPFSSQTIYYYFQLDVNTRTQRVEPSGEVGTLPTAPELSPVYRWLDSEQFAFVLLLVLSLLLGAWYRAQYRRVRMVTARRAQEPAAPGDRRAR